MDPRPHPPEDAVALVAGTSFVVSGRSGDIDPAAAEGLFVGDVRMVSRLGLLVAGRAPEPLAVVPGESWSATFLGRVAAPGGAEELLVERRRFVGDGMREDLRVRNPGGQPRRVQVLVRVGADLAGLFAVRAGDAAAGREAAMTPGDGSLTVAAADGATGVRIAAAGMTAAPGALVADLHLLPGGEWSTSLQVTVVLGGAALPAPFPAGRPVEESVPARRTAAWRARCAVVTTADAAVTETLRRSAADLGALCLPDPDDPDDPDGAVAVAAGAPWYMALFGRDALLASWMALPMEPGLALGTLRRLARAQGVRTDPRTEEQPGRILHEARASADFPLTAGAGSVYYGTADATPLFVALLGEAHRWGAPAELVRELLPHADRALEWITGPGDADGDGFLEYCGATGPGLRNQGWKDSPDGVNRADGSLPDGPIALCEVQGYAFAAYRARARLADAFGDPGTARRWRERARALAAAFDDRFWLPDRGWYAVALDGDKRPVDALTSNIGHCLWSGIVPPGRAAAVAEHLLSPAMWTGWGVRTLAATMAAYDPMSYHNGSVWPHDSVLVAAGLRRYGFRREAARVAGGVLDAATAFDGRLPELFGGFARGDHPAPVPYPSSCSPQAWASAAPVHAVRLLLGLEPDLPAGELRLDPMVPEHLSPLRLTGLRLGGTGATVTADGDRASVAALPPGLRVALRGSP